jgi:site-specific DNA recombinase
VLRLELQQLQAENTRRCRERIEAQDWTHVATFEDAGVKRDTPFEQRPDGRKLLDRLDELDVVVTPALNRLGEKRAVEDLFDTLDAAGVEIDSLSEPFLSGATASGRFMRGLINDVSAFERDQLAERVASAAEGRARQGRYNGGPPPFGYRYGSLTVEGRPTGLLVPDPAERLIVERIFTEYVEHRRSQRAIAAGLDRDGAPTRKDGRWYQGTIRQILANEKYAGLIRAGDDLIAGAHEAITPRERWEDAQRVSQERARTRGHGGGRLPTAPFLFNRGRLRCGACGEAMVPRTDHDTYQCHRRVRLGPEGCPQTPVSRTQIDTAFLDHFQRIGLDVEETQRQFVAATELQLAEARALREQAERAAQEAAAAVERARRDYKRRALSAESYEELRPEVEAESAAAAAEVERLREREREVSQSVGLEDVEEEVLRWLAELREMIAGKVRDADSIEAIRAALGRLFEGFRLHRVDEDVRRELEAAEVGLPIPARNHTLLLPDAALVIEPLVKPQAIQGYEDEMVPVLRKVPLSQARKTDANVLPTHYLFMPIPLGGNREGGASS